MLPIFKSHYSIGKSILNLNHPDADSEGGSDSIFKLITKEKLTRLILVEDSPSGFLQARKVSFELGVHLLFGLRLNLKSFGEDEDKESQHKVIVFAKNDEGSKALNRIYSKIFCDFAGVGTYKILKDLWNEDNLMMVIPFYDSFLYYNSFSFSNCVPDFSFCTPLFFLEDNGIPTDKLLVNLIKSYCSENGYNQEHCKSIYYNKRSDIEAFQTYKCICSRGFGRKKSLSNPGFDGLGSREFCFESWRENK